jgi:hypothetical protein
MTNVPKNDYVNAFKPERPPGRHTSAGLHAPDVPYVPSNPLAWGPKGAWGPQKSFEQLSYEAQSAKTMAYVGQDGAQVSSCAPTHPGFATPTKRTLTRTRHVTPRRPDS